MKIRLYKGPANGKTFDVPDHTRDWIVEVPPTRAQQRKAYNVLSPRPIDIIQRRRGYYRMSSYMHPDGSVFFIHVP